MQRLSLAPWSRAGAARVAVRISAAEMRGHQVAHRCVPGFELEREFQSILLQKTRKVGPRTRRQLAASQPRGFEPSPIPQKVCGGELQMLSWPQHVKLPTCAVRKHCRK